MRQIAFGMPLIGDEEKKAVMDVLGGPILVHGPRAKDFENAFSKYTGSAHSVSCSSCTAALHLAYFYLGIGPGDEVIVPAQTHNATAHAVELCRAKPVFVDAEGETGNIDISKIESAITPKTKALSLVHYLGMPVDMDRITAIAKKHKLFVVEDCALAIGSYFKGKHCGTFGDVGCFSFYPVKHFTTAEGGMLTTQSEKIAHTIERQRAFGVDRTASERKIPGVYDVNMLGFNYRMSEVHAAIGIEQIKKVNSFLRKRKENYKVLTESLGDASEVEFLKSSHGDFQSSYYCCSVILKEGIRAKRFEIVDYVNKQGVGTSVYYPKPVPHLSYYKEKYNYSESSFPEASRISYGSIALSVGPHLSEEDMVYTAKVFKEALAHCR